MRPNIYKYSLIIIALVILMAVFYKDPLNSYFSQDDFYHFSEIWQMNFSDIPPLFIPGAATTQFYRPVTREIYNMLMYKTFGLNPLPFHFANLLLIILNGLIFITILKKLSVGKFEIIFTAAIYFFSAVHSIQLYYLSAIQTMISTFFVLTAILSYIISREKGARSYYLLTVILYVLAILSHESSAILPVLIGFYELVNLPKWSINNFKKIFYLILPFAIILLVRILISILFLEMPEEQVYKPVFAIGPVFNTLVWFTLWTFGLPEMLTDFATLSLNFNPNLFKFYSYYTNTVFPLFLLILITILLTLLGKINNNLKDKNLWFLGLSYAISLSPFLFFPNHKFVYYLTLPVLFFSGFCGLLLGKYWYLGRSHKFLIITFLVGYLAISYQTINLNKITHWAAKRAQSANFLVRDIKNKFSNSAKGSVFYIKNDPNYPFIAKEWGTSSKQAFYILSGPDAFRLIFNDPDIKTFYEDITGPPKDSPKNLLIYEAVFPY